MLKFVKIWSPACGLYYKPITIVNDNSSIVNKLVNSLIDSPRVTIYVYHMFIVQATEQYQSPPLPNTNKQGMSQLKYNPNWTLLLAFVPRFVSNVRIRGK